MDNKYEDLFILAFPSNQFGKQEPGSPAEIKQFTSRFNVKFALTEKVNVNGRNTNAAWQYLKEQTGGKNTRWNFDAKFLVDRSGTQIKRYDGVDPNDIESDIIEFINVGKSEL